jgi:two-component system, OmpR family, alkaline phosphatase synthesis response regulator PhoP
MSAIVVVEDEAHLAQGLRFNLEAEGHDVSLFDNGEAALEFLLRNERNADVVILDVMLPGVDGFEVARELRAANRFMPVLMLTALNRPEDVLRGFESGADDYLPKPFDLAILMARIHSLLRRSGWSSESRAVPTPITEKDEAPFEFDGRTVDFRALELRTASGTFKLTLMEVQLLRYLIVNRGAPVSRKQILQNVWNLPASLDTRAIDNFIVRLRRYMEDDPKRPRYLLTVRGVGYRFVAEPGASAEETL